MYDVDYADKEVACSENIPDSRLDCTNLTIYRQESLKPYSLAPRLTYTYTAHIRGYPPPGFLTIV